MSWAEKYRTLSISAAAVALSTVLAGAYFLSCSNSSNREQTEQAEEVFQESIDELAERIMGRLDEPGEVRPLYCTQVKYSDNRDGQVSRFLSHADLYRVDSVFSNDFNIIYAYDNENDYLIGQLSELDPQQQFMPEAYRGMLASSDYGIEIAVSREGARDAIAYPIEIDTDGDEIFTYFTINRIGEGKHVYIPIGIMMQLIEQEDTAGDHIGDFQIEGGVGTIIF